MRGGRDLLLSRRIACRYGDLPKCRPRNSRPRTPGIPAGVYPAEGARRRTDRGTPSTTHFLASGNPHAAVPPPAAFAGTTAYRPPLPRYRPPSPRAVAQHDAGAADATY